mgnify:CR=1 FL=1
MSWKAETLKRKAEQAARHGFALVTPMPARTDPRAVPRVRCRTCGQQLQYAQTNLQRRHAATHQGAHDAD